MGGGGGVQTVGLYIETNIHPTILFSPPSHFKGTFAIFPQGYFIMTPPCLFHPLLQLNTKEYLQSVFQTPLFEYVAFGSKEATGGVL